MECPKCGYVRQAHDKAPENECPRCGLRISGAARRLSNGQFDHVVVHEVKDAPAPRSASQDDRARRLAVCEDCGGKVSRRAVTCPHCGRPFGTSGAAVEVRSIEMGFMEMVLFMVKAVLASIPAAIILSGIGLLVVVALGMAGR